MKKGLVITTYNSEKIFEELYETLPLNKLDDIVVINGGEEYKRKYSGVHWIQHCKNNYPSVCRNDGLNFLKERNTDYFFILEDDQLILDENIFDAYIEASNISKLGYFCFASNAWETGPPNQRTPKLQVQYSNELTVNFYQHFCNEFTFRTKKMLELSGLYKTQYRYIFDIQNVYDISKTNLGTPFWYSPDISNSDKYIKNNPTSESRLNANGERDRKVGLEFELFKKINGRGLNEVLESPQHDVIKKLKQIKNEN